MNRTIDQSTLAGAFQNTLNSISSKRPILLFPVRLETVYRKAERSIRPAGSQTGTKVSATDLCVRIFPDEILLNYYNEKLTAQEISDAKYFWLQWFIASGSDTREFEAWQVLCSRYDVDKAAWLARCLHPASLPDFMSRRPYLRINNVEAAIHDTYSLLGDTLLDEDLIKKSVQERKLEENLQKIDDHLSTIVNCVRNAEYIVDYLYDAIIAVIDYLEKRIRLFVDFYTKCESEFVGDLKTMELWDTDYNELLGMQKRVSGIASEFEGRRLSLAEMVKMYLDDPKNKDVFPSVTEETSDFPASVKSDLLPDRFLLFAEAKNGKTYVRYGNPVKKDLDLGLVPSKDMSEDFKMDADSNLTKTGKITWMTDYDEAESCGMAITLPDIGSTPFNYIYVLGIKAQDSGHHVIEWTSSERLLKELFLGHNYLGEGMSIVRKGTPTNQVDGAAPMEDLSDEEIMRLRFNVEIKASVPSTGTSSGSVSSSVLQGADAGTVLSRNFRGTDFSRVPGHDNMELTESAVAMRGLWRRFVEDRVQGSGNSFKSFITEVGAFFADYVRSTGVYPTLRVGKNPYGILPVTDYMSMLESMIHCDSVSSNIKYLYYTIAKLGARWQQLRNGRVYTVDNLGQNSEIAYLKLVSQNARSVEYRKRLCISTPLINSGNAKTDLIGLKEETPDYFKSSLTDIVEDYDIKDMIDVVKVDLPLISDERAAELVGEFIDAMSYRLDAWYTAMVCYLMDRQRKLYPEGVAHPAIGAYGWVFNLKPDNRTEDPDKDQVIKDMKLPKDSTVITDSKSSPAEYIVAPSVQHAITAAVLRSAYVGSDGRGKDPRMCINLSSARARQALRILESVKDGMATSIVLGTEFERYLHDVAKNSEYKLEMDKFIYPLRKLYPQSVDIFSPNDSRAKNYTMNVINAESLLNSIVSDKNKIYWNNSGRLSEWLEKNFDKVSPLNELKSLPECQDKEEIATLCALIERVYDSYDALNDLLLGEGVYRLVAGDKASFAAISNFMAKGSGNIPSPAILDTPLEYVAVAHKTVLPMPAASAKPLSVLANAEPRVDQWLRGMIGKMSTVVFWVEMGDLIQKSNLEILDIDPVEYLYASSSEHAFMTLLEIKWRKKYGHYTEKIRIVTGDPSQLEPGEVLDKEDNEFSIYEDSMRIDNLRALVFGSRPLRASDFAPGKDVNDEASVDVEDLRKRLESTTSYLNSLRSRIQLVYDETDGEEFIDDETLMEMYSLVAVAIECGIYEASVPYRPELMISQYDKILERPVWDKCVEVQRDLRNSLLSIISLIDDKLTSSSKIALSSVESYCEAIRKLTLASFKVLPLFRLEKALEDNEKSILSRSLGRSVKQNFSNATDQILDEWLEETASVRPGMMLWDKASMFSLAAGIETGKSSIYQIKADGKAGNEWLGTTVSSESELDDADTMVILSSSNLKEGSANSGLVIDSWIEYIPYQKHTAGMSIHIDQPDAEAPQAILLAVHPDIPGATNYKERWDITKVAEILDSTRFMLQNRAVDPEVISTDAELSKVLPLLSDANLKLIAGIGGSLISFTLKQDEYVARVGEEIFRQMPGGSILGRSLK